MSGSFSKHKTAVVAFALIAMAGMFANPSWAEDPGEGIEDFGPLNWEINTGVQFSQNKGDFSQADVYVEYLGDTLLWPSREPELDAPRLDPFKSSFHLLLSLEMARASSSTDCTDAVAFLTSRRFVTGSLGVEWRVLRSGFDKGTLLLGFVGFSGLQTPLKEISVGKSGYVFWNAGVRMQYIPKDAASINPTSLFCLCILWGDYSTIGSRRITCEGWLNLTKSLHIGFKAISPRIVEYRKSGDLLEPSDFQIFTGYTISPDRFSEITDMLIPRFFTQASKTNSKSPTGKEEQKSSSQAGSGLIPE